LGGLARVCVLGGRAEGGEQRRRAMSRRGGRREEAPGYGAQLNELSHERPLRLAGALLAAAAGRGQRTAMRRRQRGAGGTKRRELSGRARARLHRLLGGRRVVQVHQGLAVHLLVQNREVAAERGAQGRRRAGRRVHGGALSFTVCVWAQSAEEARGSARRSRTVKLRLPRRCCAWQRPRRRVAAAAAAAAASGWWAAAAAAAALWLAVACGGPGARGAHRQSTGGSRQRRISPAARPGAGGAGRRGQRQASHRALRRRQSGAQRAQRGEQQLRAAPRDSCGPWRAALGGGPRKRASPENGKGQGALRLPATRRAEHADC